MPGDAPGDPAMRLTRRQTLLALPALLAAALLVPGCAGSNQGDSLQRAQYAWSAAIRWGDFEGAWNLVDPAYRARHPLSDVEFERFNQVQVSHYRELGTRQADAGTVQREIDIGVVNRHTMAERGMRYRETWRWDEEARTWWNTAGLPDFWDGE